MKIKDLIKHLETLDQEKELVIIATDPTDWDYGMVVDENSIDEDVIYPSIDNGLGEYFHFFGLGFMALCKVFHLGQLIHYLNMCIQNRLLVAINLLALNGIGIKIDGFNCILIDERCYHVSSQIVQDGLRGNQMRRVKCLKADTSFEAKGWIKIGPCNLYI